MKLYLSSYKLGGQTHILKSWIETSKDKKIALIPNAGDAYRATPEERAAKIASQCELLASIGFAPVVLDLRQYFGKEEELRGFVKEFKAFWAVGGNTFVLRQAMEFSGFDKFLQSLKNKKEYLYGGWSAGVCVLAKSLKGLELCDEPAANPYNNRVLWEGIGFLDYLPAPHYKSDHPETKMIDNVVAYMEKHKLPYKTLRDGEVIVRDTETGAEQLFLV